MGFYEKYELLDLVEDESAKTFLARELATGRKINVFLFVGEKARAQAELIEKVRAADRTSFPELIEIGDHDGTTFIATEVIGGFTQLKGRVLGSPTVLVGKGDKSDAFTRVGMYRVPDKPAAQRAPPPGPAGPAQTIGEFTRMFQHSPAAPAAGQAAQPRQEAAPGEFTRIFGRASSVAPAAPPPPAPARSEPGEFTRLFSSGAPPTISPSPLPSSPPPQAYSPRPGEFTRTFGVPDTGGAAAAPAAPVPAAAVAEPSAKPGEYTRIFGAPTPAPPPVPAPAATPAAGPAVPVKAPVSNLTMVLLGVIVLLLAVIAVLVITR